MSRGDRGWLGNGLAAKRKGEMPLVRDLDIRPGAVNYLAPSQQIQYIQPQQPIAAYTQQLLQQQAQDQLKWQQFMQSVKGVPLQIQGVPGWTDYDRSRPR